MSRVELARCNISMERWQSTESVGVFERQLLPLGQQENCSSGSGIENKT